MKKNPLSLVLVLASLFIFTNGFAQDKKLEKAETKFCNSINDLVSSLDEFDSMNEDSTMDEFRSAYKKVQKSWQKFEKSAEKLEKVEIKESQKAYNDLVDSVNKIDGDQKTSEAAGEIDENIDNTAAKIADIMTVYCN